MAYYFADNSSDHSMIKMYLTVLNDLSQCILPFRTFHFGQKVPGEVGEDDDDDESDQEDDEMPEPGQLHFYPALVLAPMDDKVPLGSGTLKYRCCFLEIIHSFCL